MTPDFGEVVGDLQTLPTVAPFETLAARLPMTPELWASRLRADTIGARRRLAEAEAKPNLDVSLGVRRFEATRDHAVVASISIPLGGPTRSGYAVSQANAELAALEARRDAERFERHQALFDKYQELRTHVTNWGRCANGCCLWPKVPWQRLVVALSKAASPICRWPKHSERFFDLRSRAVEAAAHLSPSAGRGGTPHRHR
ncbi:hypothetical protein P4204_15800 [Pseudomonas aeruginosa]|nr:hypothetical protein [Pseudomonas aeruginosa]